jgi:hypothetical protein
VPGPDTIRPGADSGAASGEAMPRSQTDPGTTGGSTGMRSDPSTTISRAPRNDRG